MDRPKFIDDLAGVAGGALSALSGVRDEVEQLVRARIDEALRGMRLVRRDEFEATVEMAANARAAQEDASLRIAALERRMSLLERGASGAPDGEAAAGSSSGGVPPAEDHPHMAEEGGLGGPPSSPD